MKKFLLLTVAALSAAMSYAEYRAVIFKNNIPLSQTKVSNIKSITAVNKVLTQNTDDSNKKFAFEGMDSLVFVPDTVYVNYSATAVAVKNPLANLGVTVAVNGADVVVNTDTTVFDMKDVVFALSGDAVGSFRMNQLKRTNLVLNNLNLVSESGPAIAMEGNKGVSIELVGVSQLTDAVSRLATDTTSAALYVNDKLEINGSGNLSVAGRYKQGIYVKDDMVVNGGSISSVAEKTSIRVKDNFVLNNGAVKVSSNSGSGIDVNDTVYVRGGKLEVRVDAEDVKGVTCDAGYIQTGGDVLVEVNGNGSKAVKVGSVDDGFLTTPNNMSVSAGSLNVTFGDVDVYKFGGEESSPAGLKADGNIIISGTAVVTVNAPESSIGVRGIAADGDVTVAGQSKVAVAVLSELGKAWCYKVEGTLYINKACATTLCNEENPRYDTSKSGEYKCTNLVEINY